MKKEKPVTKKNAYFIALLAIFSAFLILAWLGYFSYLRYAAANISRISLLPPLILYLFAFFAGIISFFAPCAIGILPAYLSYYLNIKEEKDKKAFYYGSFAALGLASFYLVLGILIILFGQIIGMTLMAYNREISASILLIVGIGLLFDAGANIKKLVPLSLSQKLSKFSLSKSRETGLFFFGIFYGIEAFMCALLLMVPLIITPLLGGEVLTSIISFVIFSLALGLSMIIATVLMSKSKDIITEKFMASSLALKRIAGIVMILTAFFLIYLTVALPSMRMPISQPYESAEDMEFRSMCGQSGYEWMRMKPTKDGIIMKDSQECWGCMVEGVEHICDKEKFRRSVLGMEGFFVDVFFEHNPKQIKALEPATLEFSLKDGNANPVKELDVAHEKLFHAIIISSDFSIFSHIHPENSPMTTQGMKSKGMFAINYTFEKGGKYLIGTDFSAKNKPFSKLFIVNASDGPPQKAQIDFAREKKFKEYGVSLSVNPQIIKSGQKSELLYHFEKNGAPVTDMEPYLSAPMHIAVAKEDLSVFIHTHGELDSENMSMNDDNRMMDNSMTAH